MRRYYVAKTRLKHATRDLWLVLDRESGKVVETAYTRDEAREIRNTANMPTQHLTKRK